LGAGGFPEIGMKAAEASKEEIKSSVEGSHIVILTAGMGGGTGTGAAPVVAKIAKEQGALVLSFVTYPFSLERSRTKKADWGLSQLVAESDATVVVENDKLVEWAKNLPVEKAFFLADKVVGDAIKAIVETIKYPSLINLDYADLRTVMERSGTALLAIGSGKGPNRIENAAKEILNNPLLEADTSGATGALVHIEGGEKMTIGEATKLAEMVTEGISEKGNVIFGARLSNNFAPDEIVARVIITGVKTKRIQLKPKELLEKNPEIEEL
ncbi:MAG: cell division protein FtsZ, partial [Candidatus Micrarchaeia archaeon]